MRATLTLAAVLWLGAPGAAHAQALRSWVSAVGDDANPCTRTQPCATFAAGIAATVVGGEVDALDSGDFGPVAITAGITLDGRAAAGTIEGAGVSGITIDGSATDVVVIRGISIRGSGTGGGIAFNSGAGLQLVDSYVSGFQDGIVFTPAAGGQLMLTGVVVKDNSGAGVLVGSSAGRASATIADSYVEGNDIGVRAIDGARVGLYDCEASRNATAGVSAELSAAGGLAEINLEGVAVTQNGVGVRATASAGAAVVRMSEVLDTANATSPIASSGGGTILSFGNNRLDLVPLLAVSSTGTTQMVTAGETATYPIDVAVTGLTSAPIGFACSGLPAGATCQVTPATLPAGTKTGTVMLTVTTTAMSTTGGFLAPRSPSLPSLPALPTVPLTTLALLAAMALASVAAKKRSSLRRPLGAAVAVLLLGGVLAISACGSSSSGGADMANGNADLADTSGNDLADTADMTTPPAPTPTGTHAFTLTATSGSLTGTLPLSLVVN